MMMIVTILIIIIIIIMMMIVMRTVVMMMMIMMAMMMAMMMVTMMVATLYRLKHEGAQARVVDRPRGVAEVCALGMAGARPRGVATPRGVGLAHLAELARLLLVWAADASWGGMGPLGAGRRRGGCLHVPHLGRPAARVAQGEHVADCLGLSCWWAG